MINLQCEAILPECDMKDVQEIEESIMTVYKKPIWSNFIKAVNDFNLRW